MNSWDEEEDEDDEEAKEGGLAASTRARRVCVRESKNRRFLKFSGSERASSNMANVICEMHKCVGCAPVGQYKSERKREEAVMGEGK